MRNLHDLDVYRDVSAATLAYYGWAGDHECGRFLLNSPIDGATLLVIASAGLDWDHVSVSRRNRCPNWPEMDYVKRLFFLPGETAMQLHVPVAEHISIHPTCLHLWRPHLVEIPRPPSIMVGDQPLLAEPGKEAAA